MANITDGRGVTITPGDIIVYSAGSKHVERLVARVINVKKRVQIGEIDRLGGVYNPHNTGWRTEPRWVESSSCFVIGSLPFAPDRLNTN